MPTVSFGEKVWYKELRVGKDRRNNMDSEWHEGLWLGHNRKSNEVLIGTKLGIVKAYAVKGQAEDERWSRSWIQDLRGTPQQPTRGRGVGVHIPVHVLTLQRRGSQYQQEMFPEMRSDK